MQEFEELKAKKIIEIISTKSREILKEKEKVESVLEKVEEKINKLKKVDVIFEKVNDLVMVVREYLNNGNSKLSSQNITDVLSALIYLLAPMDAIPDSVPDIGYSDDIAVIKYALKIAKI